MRERHWLASLACLGANEMNLQEFAIFLKDSHMFTLEQSRWTAVQSSSGGKYFLSAVLEEACRKGGDLSDLEAIGALEYDMNAQALLAWEAEQDHERTFTV